MTVKRVLTRKNLEMLAVGSCVFAKSVIELTFEFESLRIIIDLNNIAAMKPAIR